MLHLVGILFPHINDYARSKSHQIRQRIVRNGERTPDDLAHRLVTMLTR